MRAVDNIRKKFGDAAIGRASQAKPIEDTAEQEESLKE
jgi:hypothetical protein